MRISKTLYEIENFFIYNVIKNLYCKFLIKNEKLCNTRGRHTLFLMGKIKINFIQNFKFRVGTDEILSPKV